MLKQSKEDFLYKVEKGDLSLSDLTTDGGIMLPEQANTFIRTLQEQPTLLNKVRVHPMSSPQMNINKVKFGERILQPASQNPATNDSINLGRVLKEHSKVTTDQVNLSTKEVIAEIRLNYEVLEDNIEGQSFQDTLMSLIAARAALDIEELMIQGDTGSGTPWLALLDGVLTQTTHHVVDAAGDTLDPQLMSDMVLAMPQEFRAVDNQQYFTSSNAEIVLRNTIASRNTGLGDAYLTGKQPIVIQGKPLMGIHKMPIGKAILTNPNNIILGIQRQIRLEMDRFIRERQLIFVLTARLDVKIEEELMVVKAVNLAN